MERESRMKGALLEGRSALALAFYENDFEWEQVQDLRKDAWEARPIVPLAADDLADHNEEITLHGADRDVWEKLYKTRGDGMFKTRRYIIKAFPELGSTIEGMRARGLEEKLTLVDLGCGAGASLLPILDYINNESKQDSGCRLQVNALISDISQEAVDLLKWSVETHFGHQGIVNLESMTWDLTKSVPTDQWRERGDFGLLVFTLSAIHPDEQIQALRNCVSTLKPGGRLLFRDYGAYDMIQERCKKRVGQWTVVKLDGVLCTFYTLDRLEQMFADAGLALDEPPRYGTVRNVNRRQQSEMLRVFIRAVGRKI